MLSANVSKLNRWAVPGTTPLNRHCLSLWGLTPRSWAKCLQEIPLTSLNRASRSGKSAGKSNLADLWTFRCTPKALPLHVLRTGARSSIWHESLSKAGSSNQGILYPLFR